MEIQQGIAEEGAAIGGNVTGGTTGSVLFVGPGATLAQDNANFFYDDTNNRLGIGTATPSAPIDLLKTSLGATASDVSGVLIMNTTAAAAGAQQVSPSLTLEGQGWKTNATAASQAVRFQQYVLPVQGAAAPTGTLVFAASVNGGAYANVVEVNSSTGVLLRNTAGSTVALNWAGNDRSGSLALNGSIMQLNGNYQSLVNSSAGGVVRFSATNSNSVTTYFQLFDDNASYVMAQRSGTNANAFRVYNTSASSNANYERGVFDWQTTSNVLSIGTQAGGTGTVRDIALVGGNVGIGTTSPNANALLDVSSTTKAFMPPRMTTTQKNNVASPTAGMVVYDTTLNKLCVYTTVWETITSA